MPLEVRNTADNALIHQNSYTASDFDTEHLVEGRLQLDTPYGKADMQQWYFDGIRLGYSEWKYTDYAEMEWRNDLDMVQLSFLLKGSMKVKQESGSRAFSLGRYQHNMFYAHGFRGTMRNEELELAHFTMQLTRPAFLRLVQGADSPMADFCQSVNQGKPSILSDQGLYMDLGMHQAIREILNCNYTGQAKKLFLFSKCLELLALQVDAYQRSLQPRILYCKTDYDRERILFARDYLVQHVEVPPSLGQLARVTGINEFKLKRGFKELFNNTVFGYLSDYRLARAKEELLEKKKSASEIAFDLGYSSLQHFSKAFRKKYGVSPRQLG